MAKNIYCAIVVLFISLLEIPALGSEYELGMLQDQLGKLAQEIEIPWPAPYKDEFNNSQQLRYAFAPILAAAVGDALGRRTEFVKNYPALQAGLGSVQNVTIQSYVKAGYLIGGKVIYTDDTVMARIVLEIALDARDAGWSDEEFVTALARSFLPYVMDPDVARLALEMPHYDQAYYADRAHGTINKYAMNRIYDDFVAGETDWFDSIRPIWVLNPYTNKLAKRSISSEGGCGAVMRAWPLGIVFKKNKKRAEKLAADQSRITHRNPMAQAACASLARGIAEALTLPNTSEQDKLLRLNNIVNAMLDAAKRWRLEAKKTLIDMGSEEAESIEKHLVEFTGDLNTDGGRIAARAAIRENSLSLEAMLLYAVSAAHNGDNPELVLGKTNDKRTDQAAERSESGALLGWPADEALAAALFVFIRWADRDQLELRKKEFAQQGRSWDDNSVVWYGMQEAAFTPGDSDSIATLAGALLGAYHSLKVPGSEKAYLVHNLESFKDLFYDAERVVGLKFEAAKTPDKVGIWPKKGKMTARAASEKTKQQLKKLNAAPEQPKKKNEQENVSPFVNRMISGLEDF